MANEQKIRVLSDMPVMNETGNLLHVQDLAGPASASKPTEGLANGSVFIETDTGKLYIYDETAGWSQA
jgi:hypothetical protein